MLKLLVNKLALKTPRCFKTCQGTVGQKIGVVVCQSDDHLTLAINIFPLLWTIYLSFTNYRVNRPNRDVKWIDLRNYERFLVTAMLACRQCKRPRISSFRRS